MGDVENFKPAAVAAAPSMTAPPLTSFPAVSGPVTDIEASNVRKVIAKRLQQSKQTVPHYYLTVECNMEKTMKLRLVNFNPKSFKEDPSPSQTWACLALTSSPQLSTHHKPVSLLSVELRKKLFPELTVSLLL